MYEKSSQPGKASWTCINKELGETFHSFTHLELCLGGAQLSRACATSLGRRGVGFICWDYSSSSGEIFISDIVLDH